MSADFTGLTAAVVAGLPEVTACLMVSRDGLPVGCHPAEEEHRALERWTRLAAAGDFHRGFVQAGSELWVFVRKGAYGALALAAANGRAGVILVELEDAVRQAEEARARSSRRGNAPAARDPATSDHTRRRRISLHPGRERTPRRGRQAPVPAEPAEVPAPDAGPVDTLDLVREFGGLLSSGEVEE
ncbi:MAG TPA: hypothetical protein VKA30_07235 [Actinomycetota bacterium]|nr:hypothetical protein [Actinomycetota bacterium]